MYIKYGEKEISYLSKKDKKLRDAIAQIGHVYRAQQDDLFTSLILHIVGQQISVSAVATIWNRMQECMPIMNAVAIQEISIDALQGCGLTFRKVEYMKNLAQHVLDKTIDLDSLYEKSDEQVIQELSSLKGIGVWTVEMLLISCMKRQDIISYRDLAILRGMRMLYRHKEITPALFEKYKKRYSPYASVASIYLWAIAAGEISTLSDPANNKKRRV